MALASQEELAGDFLARAVQLPPVIARCEAQPEGELGLCVATRIPAPPTKFRASRFSAPYAVSRNAGGARVC